MIHIEQTIQIERPTDEVFDFLVNADNLVRWQKGVVDVRRLSTGPMRAGFQVEETIKMGPSRMKAIYTFTEVRANSGVGFKAVSRQVDCQGRFELVPLAGGTRLTLIGAARLKGAWRFLQPLFAGEIRKQSQAEFESIKRLTEAASEPVR